MARARRPTPPDPPEQPVLKATKARAKEIIDRGITEAEVLLEQAEQVDNDEAYEDWTHDCERWDARTKLALESVFEGPFPDEYHRAATGRIFGQVGQSKMTTLRNRQTAMRGAINTLRSIEERMEFLEEPGEVLEARPRTPGGKQVFVIHGRDEGLRAQVARLLERLGLDAIILQEQEDRGRTVIEKFEDHALDVGFAVALLTPDDYGKGPDDEAWPEAPNRARQNVVLELGYFMGTLGRQRVAALFQNGTELPSDIHGVLYIPLDANWELRLAKEIKAAGLPVDLNNV
jgi:predicted nucleotide-binding protein